MKILPLQVIRRGLFALNILSSLITYFYTIHIQKTSGVSCNPKNFLLTIKWFSGKLQYQEYNTGGIIDRSADEGDRYGVGVGAGYTYMIHPHLNMEFGIGLWGGYGTYVSYSCPSCGLTVGRGDGFFILPNDIMVSLSYVF